MNREDIIREFELEAKRSDNYFSLMYKIIQFTFVAVAAVLGFAISLFGDPDKTLGVCLIGVYALPVIIYIFGTMYAFNAYAIAISGKRAQKLHDLLYQDANDKEVIKEYNMSRRGLIIISYGVTLAFYIFVPLFSILIISLYFEKEVSGNTFLFSFLPWCFLFCYYIIMLIDIIAIIKNIKHIKTKKRKKEKMIY